ncbi:MAG: bacterial transcriptional activator domain-containing protein [Chloroflexota bacterium]
MLDFLHELIREQISALDSNTKFVFIQPAYLPQHAILEMFISEPASLYVRFDDEMSTQSTVRDVLEQHLIAQFPNGGWSDVRLLVLDECDRTDLAELDGLLTEFLELPNLRVLLLSRLVPGFIRTNAAINARARFIPIENRLMFPDYIAASQKTLLEVRALGSGHVFLNGKPVSDWDGDLPRNLFFYLIDRGMATRAQIFESFWPDLPVHEATNVFHVTKRKINEILDLDLTRYSGGFYRIAPDIELIYDVSLFKDLMQRSAVETKKVAQDILARAIWLYKGDFLIGIDSQTNAWVHSRQHELSQLYGEALFTQGKLIEQAGDSSTALGLFIRASALNRQREDLAGAIMVLYRKLSMFEDALKTYERIEADISDTLGISPAQWLQDLAANIRAEAKASLPSTKISQ